MSEGARSRGGACPRRLGSFGVTALLLAVLTYVLGAWLEGMPLQITTRLGLDDAPQLLNPDRQRGVCIQTAPTCQISGVVLEAAGRGPVSGAVVALTALAAGAAVESAEGQLPWIATTNLSGRWSATVPDVSGYAVTVTAPRFLPRAFEVATPCRPFHAVVYTTLRRGGATVGGDVRGVQGEPMADAMVSVRPVGPDGSTRPMTPRRVTFTNDFGNFWLQLKPGDYLFEARVPFVAVRDRLSSPLRRLVPSGAASAPQIALEGSGRQSATEPSGYITLSERVGVGPGRNVVVLRLRPAGSIRGRVLNRLDGAPVPNAVVRALSKPTGTKNGDGRRTPSVTTDAAGDFVLQDIQPGTVLLTAAAGELATHRPTPVRVAVARWVSGIDLRVERALTMSADAADAPARNKDEIRNDGDVDLRSGASISGRLAHKPDGAVSLLVSSTASQSGNGQPFFEDVPVRADGTFSLGGLSSGRYRFAAYRGPQRLSLDLPTHKESVDAPWVLDVRQSGPQPEVSLSVQPCNAMIVGAVTGPGKAFVPQALVELRALGEVQGAGTRVQARLHGEQADRAVITNAYGTFVFASLCPGLYELAASARFGDWRARTTAVPNAPTFLQLQPTATLETTVTDRGAPVRDYALTFIAPVEQTRLIQAPSGTAVSSQLEAGRYELVVEASSGCAVSAVDLVAGHTAQVALELAPWRVIRGRLVDAKKRPQAGVVVDVSFAGPAPEQGMAPGFFRLRKHQTTTDADGRFELGHALARMVRTSFTNSSGQLLLARTTARSAMGAVEGFVPWIVFEPGADARLGLGTLEVRAAQ